MLYVLALFLPFLLYPLQGSKPTLIPGVQPASEIKAGIGSNGVLRGQTTAFVPLPPMPQTADTGLLNHAGNLGTTLLKTCARPLIIGHDSSNLPWEVP